MSFRSTLTRSRRLLSGGALVATLAVTAGIAAGGTAAVAAAPADTIEYVALGDSYAVGLGLGAVTGTVAGCAQTNESYPSQLAAALDLGLTDVTCSGATTADIITSPQVTSDGTNPVQVDALTADTDIVTLTIGGNDLGFSSIIQNCLADTATGPLLFNPNALNCESGYVQNGVDSLAAAVAGPVTESLETTLATIKTQAPNARVFVVGYPALMPDAANIPAAGCFTPFDFTPTAFPFTNVDAAYLHDVQTKLDKAMLDSTNAAGATYVPLLSSTLAKSACGNNPEAAVYGASPLPAAMHPNVSGAKIQSDAVGAAVQDALTAPTITSAAAPTATLGSEYSFTIVATGFPAPTFALIDGALPDGLSLDSTTGVISGTPTAAGDFSFTIEASNTVAPAATAKYTVPVPQAPAPDSEDPGDTDDTDTPGTPETPGDTETPGKTPSTADNADVKDAAPSTPAATTQATPQAPQLATTGSESFAPLGLVAMILVLAGAGVFTARRTLKR